MLGSEVNNLQKFNCQKEDCYKVEFTMSKIAKNVRSKSHDLIPIPDNLL